MSNSTQDQEINLSEISKGISDFFQNRIDNCFDLLFFVKKKIIIIAALFFGGIALGVYYDSKPTFTSEIVAIPNFGSNEYLYDKIGLIQSKIKEGDENFFKTIGINNVNDFKSIEIKPVNGVYNFINMKQSPQNFEFIKLMAEDGDLDKIIKDDITSKNYYQHIISIKTNVKYSSKELVEPILKYLQASDFYGKLQKVYQKNLADKHAANKLLIDQIDNLIVTLSKNNGGGGVTVSSNSGITELVNKKDALTSENQEMAIQELEFSKIIKDQIISTNSINTKGLNDKYKLFLPFFFVFLYLFGFGFIKLYDKQKLRISK